jgi:hypothetical protein
MSKPMELTKKEFETLSNLSTFIASEQDRFQRIQNALNLEFKTYIAENIFPRLGIDLKLLDKCVIDMSSGILTLPEPEKPPTENKK